MKVSFFSVFFLIFFLFIATGLVLRDGLRHYACTPMDAGGQEKIITIQPGEGFRNIAERMEKEGIIEKALLLRILARLQKRDTRVHSGEYPMSPALSPQALLDMMVEGRVRRYRLTLPEGLRITEIARRATETGLVTEEAFLAIALDPEFAKTLGIPSANLEGYLFPDTYFFTKTDNARSMIRTMVQHFQHVFDAKKKQRAQDIGLSLHEVVTLASLIEKETGHPDERPLIASVFHNRLARGMRLETDPTVIYGIPDYDGRITRTHLRTATPYNTYRIKGLPPGPIASPGKASLEAALWPADTPYLFFVSKNNGSHHFSKTLTEHNRAVNHYQRNRGTVNR